LNFSASQEQQNGSARLNAFARADDDLFSAYLRLVAVTIEAKQFSIADCDRRYDDAVRKAENQHEASATAAHVVCQQAIESSNRNYWQKADALRACLNEDLALANADLHKTEVPARAGSKEKFAAIDRTYAVMQFAAAELGEPDLLARGSDQYRQSREQLIAAQDAAMAPARALYQKRVEQLHLRFNESLDCLRSNQDAFAAPFIATRAAAVARAHEALCIATGLACIEREKNMAQIQRHFYALEEERHQQLVQYLDGGAKYDLLRYFDSAVQSLQQLSRE